VSNELPTFPVVIEWPIQWGDQDSFGHANNIIYFRWFESARIAYLERLGRGQMMNGVGLGPILAAINCNYRKQLTYPDTLLIGAKITRIGNSSFTMTHAIYSKAAQAIAADGESVIVMMNYDIGKSVRVPDDVRQAIAQLEGRSFE
jgi:acyl-CoA thioester hydrolase